MPSAKFRKAPLSTEGRFGGFAPSSDQVAALKRAMHALDVAQSTLPLMMSY